MIITAVKNKIKHLRRQPDHVKYRAVTLLTAITGGIIAVIWLTVLLPFQLKLNNPSSNSQQTTRELSNSATNQNSNNNEQVGGIISSPIANPNNNAPNNDYFMIPTASPLLPSVTPTLSVDSLYNLLPSNEASSNQ
ncbi:MAG: hypothetical protein Q8P73_00810 [bacterium]|nr:hypothetical protein [bacterium]MDZ4346422.1 hypothetical protein [Candidatus Binatia bacterium]